MAIDRVAELEKIVAEQAMVIKVSGGIRTEAGIENFAAISSIVGTAIKQGKQIFQTFMEILSGKLRSFSSATE